MSTSPIWYNESQINITIWIIAGHSAGIQVYIQCKSPSSIGGGSCVFSAADGSIDNGWTPFTLVEPNSQR